MAHDPKTPFTELVDQARGMMAINPMLAPHLEQFWKAQSGILEETEAFSQAWFQRRHEAAGSALKAVQEMKAKGADPESVLSTIADWQQQSFRRLNDDMLQWVELCSRCAGRMTSAEIEAERKGVEETAKRAKSTAKAKHAIPV